MTSTSSEIQNFQMRGAYEARKCSPDSARLAGVSALRPKLCKGDPHFATIFRLNLWELSMFGRIRQTSRATENPKLRVRRRSLKAILARPVNISDYENVAEKLLLQPDSDNLAATSVCRHATDQRTMLYRMVRQNAKVLARRLGRRAAARLRRISLLRCFAHKSETLAGP